MGIFDRLRSAAPPPGGNASPDASGQDATRMIDEGHALEAQGRLDEAMQCYLEAIRLAPNPARGHLNRGNVLLLQGDLNGALDAFRTALEHQPDYAGVYYNIGNALLGNRQFDEAVASYRSALEINPDYAEVYCSLGVALKELGQFDKAVDSFRRALQIEPALVEAHLNLGDVLQAIEQTAGAMTCYRRALEINPDFAEAHNNLGVALQELGHYEDAVACYRQALEIKADFAEAHNSLGLALLTIGQLDGAMANCRRALEIKPDFAEAHNNLGLMLHAEGQFVRAMASYLRALETKPELAEARCNLGNVHKDLGKYESAEESYRRVLEIKPGYVKAHSNLLFVLNYTGNQLATERLEEACKYGRAAAERVDERYSVWQCATQPERLRVGLVSGDLCNHPVGHFLEGLLANIDPARLELIAYPTQHKEDELTARIKPFFSAWKPLVGKNDEDAASLIHADGVHVLLDISGHTAHNRLPVFAWKPAPVQASWLGYFATTGLAEMDYVLADEVGVPKTRQEQFTEIVWYLPDTRLCFTPPAADLAVTPLPALSSGRITLGCFQNLSKLNDDVFELWGKVLAAVPDARLRIQCKQLGETSQVEQLLQHLQRYGIDPTRVMAQGASHREAYLAAHSEVDMILDTFPFPGGTTTCEALWMGVPTLTLAGDRLLSRQGASLLTAVGLADWVANSEEEYLAKAIALAGNLSGLAALRAGLRQQVLDSPLFDARRFAGNFEDALWGMWDRYQVQQGHQA